MRTFTFASESGVSIEINTDTSPYKLSNFNTAQLGSRAQTVVTPENDGRITYGVWRQNRRVAINGFIDTGAEKSGQKRMDELRQALCEAFDPASFGTLTYRDYTGAYSLRCRSPSLPVFKKADQAGYIYQFSISLEGDKPHFVEAAARTAYLGTSYAMHRFPLFLPDHGVPFAALFSDVNALNPVNIPIYPLLEVSETYGENIHIKNSTTGASLKINRPVENGEKLIIDTANATVKLYKLTGGEWRYAGNYLNWLSIDSDIKEFYLVPGQNILNINNDLTVSAPVMLVSYYVPAIGV